MAIAIPWVPRVEAVEARVQYVLPNGSKPFSYEYDPPPGQPLRSATFHECQVQIHDARQLVNALSLDVHGFAQRQHATRVKNFYDTEEVESVYHPELDRLLKDATGARSTLIFDHTVRGNAGKEPVHRVHNDYTRDSAPRRVRDLLPREAADRLLEHRVLEVNVWRPIRGPLQTMPLAMLDASSMAPDDFVTCDLLYRDRKGEIYYVKYNKRHRWYYYPDMQRDEVLLLKCYDSDPARGGPGAHTAFAHPRTPPDALPRESIESRAFLFFGS